MDRNDLYSFLGSVISGILAVFSWFWDIPPLQFLFTFVLGASITYLFQSRLQDRAEKRKITREIIEKIYGPIYIELQEIEELLIQQLETPVPSINGTFFESVWEEIQTYPEFFTVPLELRRKIDSIINKSEEINNEMNYVKSIVSSTLIEKETPILQKYIMNVGHRLAERNPDGPIFFFYKTEIGRTHYFSSLIDHIILDNDPTEMLKLNIPDYDPERSYVRMDIEKDGPSQSHEYKIIEVPLTKLNEELNTLLEETKQAVREKNDVVKLLEKRREVSEEISEILPVIKKHIEKHYPMENI